MSSLKKQAFRGAAWTFVAFGSGQALRFVSNIILTRLLIPEYFGLMSLINVFIIGLNLFSDIGIGPSIIQNRRADDPDFFNTAWTIQVIRGFGIWLCSLLIAWPIATFYEEPKLFWFIPIVGLNSVFNGFNSTAIFTLTRRLEVGKRTIFDLVTQVISIVVMNIWALLNPTVWALVGGNLLSGLVRMVGSHQLLPEISNRFVWDKAIVKEILSFGKWIFVSTATLFLAMQADRIMLGKLFTLEIFGVYSIAIALAELPRQIVDRMSNGVIFPIIAQFKDLPRRSLRAKILKKRWLLLVAIALIVTFLISFGDLLILALYDERYKDAAWMLPILSLGLWPILLTSTINTSLIAIGKPIYGAYGNVLKLIYMVVVLPLGFSLLGNLGAIIAIAFNDLPLYGAISYGLWREKLTAIVQDITATLLLVVLITLFLTARYILGFGLPIDGII